MKPNSHYRDFEEWAEIFHDEVIATTLFDRLIENCQVLKLTGGSYRLKCLRRSFKRDKGLP